ncbi:AMP-binding protein [Tsukamurella sp. 8F]|uniref:AMP-binding protein n=1 Tax=unclassified Tsukamurella TaxID=2633480 RepID=UPI0023BA2F7B|nr:MULTISPECIES: AMP-binding protein [unclassified Tsukamurella]MDF0528376.1 AMP-binding protein [Tsukamurella sp. 8J]MDF0586201.1 AMP-binding protein [Tsukamurella sp. 8F]
MSPDTVPGLVREAAELHAGALAITDHAVTLTYAELYDAVRRTATAYLALGVGSGDRVAIWAPNRHEFVLALLGAQMIGAAVVPLNTRYRGPEARDVLERSGARVLLLCNGFLETDYLGMLRDAPDATVGGDGPIPGLPSLRTVIDLGFGGAALGWDEFLAGGVRTEAGALDAAIAGVTPDTLCDVLYTSGTTGRPKGVMSSHRQTVGIGRTWAEGAELSPSDRYGIVSPFFHGFGYKAGVIAALTAGSSIHPVLTFDPPSLLAWIEAERITVLPGAPTVFIGLLGEPQLSRFDTTSLRFATCGAATVPDNLFPRMLDELHFDRVAQAYGLTECLVVTMTRPGTPIDAIAESTGQVVPGLAARIVAPSGADVPSGTDGELLLRGPSVMLGYLDDEVATRAAVDDDGWLHTGDVAHLDSLGGLKITDRLKDMFTVGGFNVYPAEVENTLSTHPDVVEAAVVGVPDDRLGEVGHAFIVPREGAVDATALSTFCRDRLANYKVPRGFSFVDAFPRTASGKVVKRGLRP